MAEVLGLERAWAQTALVDPPLNGLADLVRSAVTTAALPDVRGTGVDEQLVGQPLVEFAAADEVAQAQCCRQQRLVPGPRPGGVHVRGLPVDDAAPVGVQVGRWPWRSGRSRIGSWWCSGPCLQQPARQLRDRYRALDVVAAVGPDGAGGDDVAAFTAGVDEPPDLSLG